MVYVPQTWAAGASGGTPLSAERLNYIEAGIASAHRLAGGILLDSFTGSDDDKLTAAIRAQQSTPGMPAIVLGERNHNFNQTRSLYSGLKLIGARPSGPKNLELSGSNFVASRVTLGSGISSAEKSWWVNPDTNVYDVLMADFAVGGNGGSSVHQFLDCPVSSGRTLYACEFRSLSFNYMRSVFGRKDRPCALTQVTFSGHWTALNFWETQFTIGGADNNLWMGGQINIGCSISPKQTGRLENNDYELIFSTLSKTNVGYIFMTAMNGWRGLKIVGSGFGLFFYGGTYEGYKPSGTTSMGPAPGSVIRIEGGSGAFYGTAIGQGMNDPSSDEGGLVHQTGGEWTFVGPSFYRGSMSAATPCMAHRGGRLAVVGATRAQRETWTSRPVYASVRATGDSGDVAFSCLDGSMVSA